MPLNKDRVVEVLYKASPRSLVSLGSGYLVGGALVLTAAHNVGPGEVFVRVSGVKHTAQVLLQGNKDVADIALLEITDEEITALQCRYGEIDRTSSARISCCAAGFPLFKDRTSKTKKKRLYAQVDGVIPTLENLGYRYQLLSLQVTATPGEAPKPPEAPELSEWQGISGAVVFAEDDIIVGVISHH